MDDSRGLIRLIPKQQPVVWGGRLLAERLGKPPSDEPIGESWEIWEGDRIANSDTDGQTLDDLVRQSPRDIMGSIAVDRGWRRFPLLTKFIDAHEPLSVQVHPDDAEAQRLEDQPNGKTEAWHIISAEPGAWIIHGLTGPVDGDEFRRRLEDGTADDLLRKVTVSAGQTVFVPARTIHAIGPGILLHEVQQTSDVTYRLYDWNRQSQGSKRELHLDKGLEVSLLESSAQPVIQPLRWRAGEVSVEWLLATHYFSVQKIGFPGTVELNAQGRTFHILTVLQGPCAVLIGDSRKELQTGQSALVPAKAGSYSLTSGTASVVLVEYLQDREQDVAVGSATVDADAVAGFMEQFSAAPLVGVI